MASTARAMFRCRRQTCSIVRVRLHGQRFADPGENIFALSHVVPMGLNHETHEKADTQVGLPAALEIVKPGAHGVTRPTTKALDAAFVFSVPLSCGSWLIIPSPSTTDA